MVTEELLCGLATSKSSTELHGRRSRASSTGLVLTSRRLPVCSPVSLWLITTGPGSSSTSRPGGDKPEGDRSDKPEGDRAAYRKAPGGEDKAGAAGPGSAPMEFRG